jgi:signal transduction histidine kinase
MSQWDMEQLAQDYSRMSIEESWLAILHDMRNPLNIASGYAQLLQDDLENNLDFNREEAKTYIEGINKYLDLLLNMMNATIHAERIRRQRNSGEQI